MEKSRDQVEKKSIEPQKGSRSVLLRREGTSSKFSRFWDSIVGVFLLILLVPLMIFVAIGAAIVPPEEYRD